MRLIVFLGNALNFNKLSIYFVKRYIMAVPAQKDFNIFIFDNSKSMGRSFPLASIEIHGDAKKHKSQLSLLDGAKQAAETL